MERVTDPSLIEQLEAATPGEPVTDESLIRQLDGVAPLTVDNIAADQLAVVKDIQAGRNLPAVRSEADDPSGTGTPTDRLVRVGKAGVSAARESFAEGGELGIDGSTGVTKAATGLIDAILRTVTSAIRGGAAAAGQTAREAGASQGSANRLERDLVGMTEAAAVSPASTPLRAAPKARVADTVSRVDDETQAALRAAERLDVDVPRGVTGNLMPRAAGAIADTPLFGEPLADAARKATAKLEQRVDEIADSLGGATIAGAGDTAKDALITWTKVTSKEDAARIFEPVEAIVKDHKGPLSRTGVVLRDLEKQAHDSGLPVPKIVTTLQEALKIEGGLSWRAMQRLRTEIGDLQSGSITPEPGMSQRALKALYGGLSEDLKFLVGEAGKKGVGKKAALDEWAKANTKFQTEIAARRSAIEKIVGNDGSASAETVTERLIQMASAKGGADMDRLRRVRSTLDDSAWNELASAAIGRMGQSKDGFSIARWRTDYHKLSNEGKDLLFSPEHRAALDDIATVGGKFENLQKLGNPSGSARMGIVVSGFGIGALNPLALLASAVGVNVMARIFAKPATARATADWSKAWVSGGHSLTEETYARLRRTTLDLRTVLDREGIEAVVARPAILTNSGASQ